MPKKEKTPLKTLAPALQDVKTSYAPEVVSAVSQEAAQAISESPNLTEEDKQEGIASVSDPQMVERAIQRSESGESFQPSQGGGVKDTWEEALTFFAPNIIGGLFGGLVEGTEGMIQGMDAGQALGDSYRQNQMAQAKLANDISLSQLQNQARGVDVTNFVDMEGNPVRHNKLTGEFFDAGGSLINPAQVKRTNVFTQDRTIDMRNKDRAGITERFNKKYGLEQEKASQMSDAQVDQFKSILDTFSALDETLEAKQHVNTNIVTSKLNDFLEVVGMAPEAYTKLKTLTNDTLAKYVKSISGVAVSEKEFERLSTILPNVKDQNDVFVSKLNTVKQILERNRNNLERAIKSGQPIRELEGLTEALQGFSKPTPKKAPSKGITQPPKSKGITQMDVKKTLEKRRQSTDRYSRGN